MYICSHKISTAAAATQVKSSRKSVRGDRARGFHPLLKGEEEDEENRRHFVDSTLRNVTGHIQNTKWV